MEKGLWEKLIEEYPEHEEDIKNTFGYQAEQLGKVLRGALRESENAIFEVLKPFLIWLERQLSKLKRRQH